MPLESHESVDKEGAEFVGLEQSSALLQSVAENAGESKSESAREREGERARAPKRARAKGGEGREREGAKRAHQRSRQHLSGATHKKQDSNTLATRTGRTRSG